MLRGRCSCAISERPGAPSGTHRTRPTPSPFAVPSLFRMLSPTIPVHPRNAPVSPIIPIHTQKQGGGGCLLQISFCYNSFVFFRSVNHILNYMNTYIVGAPTISFRERTTATQQLPDRRAVCSSNRELSTVDCELPSPLTPLIPAPLATAALRVVPAPIFTTTLRIHCRRADNFMPSPEKEPLPYACSLPN